MDRLHAMELFARVIETGSISAAARDLRLGQPAVSKGLAALEARLGVRLLVRTTRKLNPTDAGVALYERARRVLADADEAETAARGVAAGLDGRLRISAPVTFARMHLAPKLPAFLAAHPKLRLKVIMDDRDVDLLGENIDVALRVGTLPDSSLVARRIARCERCVVASPAYLAQAGTTHSPSDLLAHQAVIYVQGSGVMNGASAAAPRSFRSACPAA
jgi:DNA-binding transcriptional LysR family regulator